MDVRPSSSRASAVWRLLLQALLLLLLRASMSGFDVHMAGGIAQLGSAPDFPDTHTVAHTYTQSQRSFRGLRVSAPYYYYYYYYYIT